MLFFWCEFNNIDRNVCKAIVLRSRLRIGKCVNSNYRLAQRLYITMLTFASLFEHQKQSFELNCLILASRRTAAIVYCLSSVRHVCIDCEKWLKPESHGFDWKVV